MSDISETLKIRDDYRQALFTIRDTICKLETDQIDLAEAKKAHIIQLPMSLEKGSHYKPYFFTPYEQEYRQLSTRPYPTYKPNSPNHCNVQGLHYFIQSFLSQVSLDHPPGICSKSWCSLNFGDLFEPNYFWKASYTCLALTNPSSWPRSYKGPNEALPHMKCLVESDVIGDDRLNRGELITIINVMASRLYTKSVRPHVVAPVMLYSIMGPKHLRVLEASFNGTDLIVRQTKL